LSFPLRVQYILNIAFHPGGTLLFHLVSDMPVYVQGKGPLLQKAAGTYNRKTAPLKIYGPAYFGRPIVYPHLTVTKSEPRPC